MKKDGSRAVIWPVYIDSKQSKKEGRKIAKKYAVSSPTLTEISKAAKKLNLNPEIENDKLYPSKWWEPPGRIIVDKNMPKREVLIKISNIIKSSRTKS